jgi:hypothetical protein
LIILYPFSVWYVCKLDSWAYIVWVVDLGLKTGYATMWLKKFLPDLRAVDSIERSSCDNELLVLYAHNNKKMKPAKHINIRFYVVKENPGSDH